MPCAVCLCSKFSIQKIHTENSTISPQELSMESVGKHGMVFFTKHYQKKSPSGAMAEGRFSINELLLEQFLNQ